MLVQYRHSIPAPVDRTSVSAWLFRHSGTTCQKTNNPSTSMTHVVCESKLRAVARSSMHPHTCDWVPIGLAVVYHARSAHVFSAGINCRHCSHYLLWLANHLLSLSLPKSRYIETYMLMASVAFLYGGAGVK